MSDINALDQLVCRPYSVPRLSENRRQRNSTKFEDDSCRPSGVPRLTKLQTFSSLHRESVVVPPCNTQRGVCVEAFLRGMTAPT